jgi:hypothetical protein
MTMLAEASSNLTKKCVESVESCSYEEWGANSGDWGEFGNSEERKRPPLEAATKQRLVKTRDFMCADKGMECVTQWGCRSYL